MPDLMFFYRDQNVFHFSINNFILTVLLIAFFGSSYISGQSFENKNYQEYDVVGALTINEQYVYTGVGQQLILLDNSGSGNPIPIVEFEVTGSKVTDIIIENELAFVTTGIGLQITKLSPSAEVQSLSFINTPGYAESVVIQGQYAYVADGGAGLRIIDISDSVMPLEISFSYINGYAFDIETRGSYAYIAGAGSGLRIVDISDPFQPQEVGGINTPGYAYGLTVDGNIAYVADGWEGIRIINISNKSNPIEIGYYNTPGWAFDVAADGGILYVADAFAGVRVIDISNLKNPVEIGAYEGWVDIHDISISNGVLYASDRKNGIRTIEINDPTKPRSLGLCELGNFPVNVDLIGNTQFPSFATNKMKSDYSVYDKVKQKQIGKDQRRAEQSNADIQLNLVGQIGGPTQVGVVNGNYAYVGIGLRVEILDVTDQSAPRQIGATATLDGYVTDIDFTQNFVYVTVRDNGLWIIDISDPTDPEKLGFVRIPGYVESVDIAGDYAYVAAGGAGLRIVDISDPFNPDEISYIYNVGYAFDVEIVNNAAYVAGGGSGLILVDISDPENPNIINEYNTSGHAQGIKVLKSIAYIADHWEGLRVIDVSDQNDLREISFFDTPGQALDVDVKDDYAYIADALKGLRIINISSPEDPIEIGSYDVGGHFQSVFVDGITAFVADSKNGFRIINTTDPNAPEQAGLYSTIGFAEGVDVSGDYVYVAAGFGGLRIVDVSDPNRPLQTGHYPMEAFANLVRVHESHAIVNGFFGSIEDEYIHVVDVSDPEHPIRTTHLEPQSLGPLRDISIVDGIAYCPNEWGLVLIDISDPFDPHEVGYLPTEVEFETNTSVGIGVSYPYAYVVVDSGLAIIDVTDPSNLTIAGTFEKEFFPQDITINGNVGYFTDGALRVLDLSDPINPIEISQHDVGGFRVRIDQDIAFIAMDSKEIVAVDVSNPENLNVLDRPATNHRSRELTVSGNHVYVADGEGGVLIFEIIPSGSGKVFDHEQNTYSDTLMVTTIDDDGDGSFRRIWENIDENQVIMFDPSVFPPDDPATIALLSELPAGGGNYNLVDASNAGVILSGENFTGYSQGLNIAGHHTTIRGLQILNFSSGIEFHSVSHDNIFGGDRSIGEGPVGQGNVVNYIQMRGQNNVIVGNLIGVNASGTQMLSDEGGIGFVDAQNNRIGGEEPWERNIIAHGIGMGGIDVYGNSVIGNYVGVDISGSQRLYFGSRLILMWVGTFNNLVKGNLIAGNVTIYDPGSSYNTIIGNTVGLDASGTVPLGGQGSIGAAEPYNRIGGTNPDDRNVVVGDDYEGIGVSGHDNIVLGNYIGTDVAGTAVIGNGRGISCGGEHNFIGGMTEEERNVLGGNAVGIYISGDFHFIAGNNIGADVYGSAMGNNGQGINFERGSNNYIGPDNIIANNHESGIEIGRKEDIRNTITRNTITNNGGLGIRLVDGGNTELPPPVLGTGTYNTIVGTAPPDCVIEIFSDPEDEGMIYEGTTMSDSNGNFSLTISGKFTGPYITATATDVEGNTSEFSTAVLEVIDRNLPFEFSLDQNYPNPFNPATTIEFSIPKVCDVSLIIYDLMGRQVTKLLSKELSPGRYKTIWRAKNVASGVYFYKLVADDFIRSKKLILLK
jgi:parallel beta-helix repeat protein